MKISGFLNSFRDLVEKQNTENASLDNYDAYIAQRLSDVKVDSDFDSATLMDLYKSLLYVKQTELVTEELYDRIIKRFDKTKWTNEKKSALKLKNWASHMDYANILKIVDYLEANMDSIRMDGDKISANQNWIRIYGILEYFFLSDFKVFDPFSDNANQVLDGHILEGEQAPPKAYIESVGSTQPLTLHMLEAGIMEKVIFKLMQNYIDGKGTTVSLLLAVRWIHNFTNRFMTVCQNANGLVNRTLKNKVEKEIRKKEKIEKRADDLAKKRDEKLMENLDDDENDDLKDVFGAEDVSDVEDNVEARILKVLDHVDEDNYVQSYEKHLLFGETKEVLKDDKISVKIFGMFCTILKSFNSNVELESDYSIQGSIVRMELQNHIWSSFTKLIELYSVFNKEKLPFILNYLVQECQMVDILCDYLQLASMVPEYDHDKYNAKPQSELEGDLSFLQRFYEYTLKMKVLGQVFWFLHIVIGDKTSAPLFSHAVCNCIDLFQESVTKIDHHYNKILCDATLSIVSKYLLVSKESAKQIFIQYTDFTEELLRLFNSRDHVDGPLLHHIYGNLLGLLQVLELDEFLALEEAHNLVDGVISDFNSSKRLKTFEDICLRQATIHFFYAMMKILKSDQSNHTNRILAKLISSEVPQVMNDFVNKELASMKNKKSKLIQHAHFITLPSVFATGSIMESALSSVSRDVREQAAELFKAKAAQYQMLIHTYRTIEKMKKEEFSYSTVIILIACIIAVIVIFPIAGSFIKKS
eukprot:CAMPEP_0117424442 /NCGR_PEP_ID=MMETSP0758-20121206/4859_1 /TAXON_ID=63605 /ORGANISM="Percolomonas cosmopolitus, Strain AE-1 (ATCC 50343)" /LENGTH=755 /DNA_ID=CAMNT_0005208221 /DNA_START=21 /DNA_END=2288 /DNA_ORIENTATION=-